MAGDDTAGATGYEINVDLVICLKPGYCLYDKSCISKSLNQQSQNIFLFTVVNKF